MAELKYKRVLLKLSGEALAGEKQIGIDPHTVSKICAEIADVVDMGLEVALVIGGGNIFRGLSASAEGMDRSSADYMGMLATVLNALAVQDALEKTGHPTRVLSAIAMQEVCEPYVRRDANDQLKKLEKDKAISEDELKKATDDVQKLTDKYVAKVDEKCAAKEKEIMDL